jgi:anhydro-N-acetylmuramic acid kinase
MANLTNLPRSGLVTGFDTGPGNVLLDAWTRQHFGGDFDRGGRIAARGKAVARLLKALLADPYFRRPPPKSTGRDRFNLSWLRRFGAGRLDPEDVQATLSELTARSIGNAVESVLAPAQRRVFMAAVRATSISCHRIRRTMPGIAVASTELLGIHPDWWKQPPLLGTGAARREARTWSIPGVTGAEAERVLGAIYLA